MAYAFDQTMNALGLTNNEEETPSSNVFGEQGAQNNASPQAAQSSGTTLANTEGDSTSGAGGSSSGAPNSGAPKASPTSGGKNRIMAANAGKAQAPTDFNKITSSISGARQDIQNKSNAYVQNAGNDYNELSNQAHNNVADYAAGKAPQTNWLTQFQSAPSSVDPLHLDTNTTVADVDLLGTDAGINQLFRRGQDAEGSMGEAALDTALLRKSQPFQVQRDETLSNYKNLQNEKTAAEQNSGEKAQAVRNAAADAYRNKVGEEARLYGGGLDSAAAAREQGFDSKYNAGSSLAGAKTKAQQLIDNMKASGNYSPEVAAELGAGDIGSYYSGGNTGETTHANDFYTQDEADQWNRVMSLIDQGGDSRAAGTLANANPDDYFKGNFREADYVSDALKSAVQKAKSKADIATAASAKKSADKQQKEDATANTKAMYDKMDAEDKLAQSKRDNPDSSFEEEQAKWANPLATLAGYRTPGQIATKAASKAINKAWR